MPFSTLPGWIQSARGPPRESAAAPNHKWLQPILETDALGGIPSPDRWLGLLKHARAVVTSSYHGIAYSIRFRKLRGRSPRGLHRHAKRTNQ